MRMPDAAGHIIKTLRQNGYEAYIVGGCVRDMLLHREPKDWDITTSARPDEIKRLFR
ncbi:MAG: polynucleotide adenylyltransferase, partial [Eubacterium sp.]|nr:polynucleotide adenylyltransferase [Eubacterium sp.]